MIGCYRLMLASLLLAGLGGWHLPASAQPPSGKAAGGQLDWPQFLGPHRNGISAESGLIEAWPEKGLPEVWRVEGGVGMSGLAIRGNHLLTMIQKNGQQWLVALRADTGKPLWQTPISSEFKNPMGDGPRATPTIAGETAFAYGGDGVLAAVNLTDGKLLWSHNVVTELKGKVADYGMASSPLVAGEQVIVTAGAPGAAVAAYHTVTGKKLWTAGDETAGYSSPALLTVGGKPQVVAFTGGAALGLAPQTGAVLWRYPYVTDFDCNIAVPISENGRVLLSSGENHGSVLLALVPQGETFQTKEVWKSQGLKSTLRSEWQTAILLDGHLYGLDNVGSAGPVTHLTCLNAATGEPVWQQPRFGKSNLIAADGKLLFSTMKGEVVIARATPKSYEEIGRMVVLGSTRQAPALAGGKLYLRDDREIVCLDVRKP